MTPEHFAALPPWLQVVLSVVVFAGAFWVYVSGLFSKLPQPPAAKKADPVVADAVVTGSISMFDKKVIEDWINELRQDGRREDRRAEVLQKLDYSLSRIDDRLEQIYHLLRDRLREGDRE